MSLTEEELIWIEEEVIWKRIPDLKNWRPDEVLHDFGANDLDWVEEVATNITEFVLKFRDSVGQLSDQSISEIRQKRLSGDRIDRQFWCHYFKESFLTRKFQKPPPAAYGFGHKSFTVDFAYWVKMPDLSQHEFAMLSVGANPKSYSRETISNFSHEIDKGTNLWSSMVFLSERYELIRRYYRSTGYRNVNKPIKLLKKLIDQIELDIHPGFYSHLETSFPRPSLSEKPAVTKNFVNQERETVLKLIAAMACEQYCFDPVAKRSPSIKDISDDLAKKSVSLWTKKPFESG